MVVLVFQLSILRYLLCDDKRGDYNSASDIVRWVRDVYCHHAVETQAQLQYIADVCQLPVGDMTIGSKWGGDTNFPKVTTGIDEKYTIYDDYTIYDEYLEWEEEHYDDGMDILFEDFGTCLVVNLLWQTRQLVQPATTINYQVVLLTVTHAVMRRTTEMT